MAGTVGQNDPRANDYFGVKAQKKGDDVSWGALATGYVAPANSSKARTSCRRPCGFGAGSRADDAKANGSWGYALVSPEDHIEIDVSWNAQTRRIAIDNHAV